MLSNLGVRRWRRFGFGILAGSIVAFAVSAYAAKAPFGYSLSGKPVATLGGPGTKAIVLLFVATDCPISNRYVPLFQKLESEYEPQHVVFWYVYPNTGETQSGVRQHEAAFGPEAHVVLDPQHQLVDLTHAAITPEAAILAPGADGPALHVLYLGRIDNRYLRIGLQRPHATRIDLQLAIEDVLQHRPVERPQGPPVGCGIIGQQ